jgi:Family of unknown function (DUF6152)
VTVPHNLSTLSRIRRGFGKLGTVYGPEQQKPEEMTVTRIMTTLGLLAAFSLSATVLAHHGWSEYDSSKTLNLTGIIKESGYEHPHGHIRLETPDKTWLVILAPPSRMQSRGLPSDALKSGNKVMVTGYPNRSKPEELRAERITIDGKTVELR